MHAEQNAIISASRKSMIGSSLYLVSYRQDTKEYDKGATACQMCRKMSINAGIENVIVRGENELEYKVINVSQWIENADLLQGKITY